MQIVQYGAAKALGLTRYFTGESCAHGHIAERKVSSRACVVCYREGLKTTNKRRYADPDVAAAARDKAKHWRLQNPERYRQNQRRYHQENRADLSEKARKRPKRKRPTKPGEHQRRYANPEYVEKSRARARCWRAANPGAAAASVRRWQQTNPERAKAVLRAGWMNRRARQRAAPGKVSAKDVREIRAADICAKCAQSHPKMEIDHIIPISRGGTNHRSNLQLLCQPCNRRKWANL